MNFLSVVSDIVDRFKFVLFQGANLILCLLFLFLKRNELIYPNIMLNETSLGIALS